MAKEPGPAGPARPAGLPGGHRRRRARCSTAGYDAVRIAGGGRARGHGVQHGRSGRPRSHRRPGPRGVPHGRRPRPARSSRARPAHLRNGGEPGDAGLGAVAAGDSRSSSRRSWPPSTRSPARAVAASAIIPWLTWLGAGAAPFVIGLALAYALALTGATPDPPAAPVDPDRFPLDVAAVAVLATVLGTIALAWGALRFLRRARRPGAGGPVRPRRRRGGRAWCCRWRCSVLWLVNPFAALLLTPTLHLWILATLIDPAPPQRARIAMVAAGLLLPGACWRCTSSSPWRSTRSAAPGTASCSSRAAT